MSAFVKDVFIPALGAVGSMGWNGLGMVSAMIPIVGKYVSKVFFDQAVRNNEDTAEMRADYAKGEARQNETISKQETLQAEAMKKSEKAQLEMTVTQANTENATRLFKIEQGYRKTEAETQGSTNRIKSKGTHYKSMTEIHQELTAAAEQTTKDAKVNQTQTQLADAAVMTLNEADKLVVEAHAKLIQSLNAFEKSSADYLLQATKGHNQDHNTINEGQANIGVANAVAKEESNAIKTRAKIDIANGHKVIEAFLDVYKAEQDALTKLKIDCGKQESGTLIEQKELEYAKKIQPILDEQLESRRSLLNFKVDEKLAGFHLDRLNDLSKQVQAEISETQQKISQDPNNLTANEQHLGNLTQFAERIKTIAAQKGKSSPEQTQTQTQEHQPAQRQQGV